MSKAMQELEDFYLLTIRAKNKQDRIETLESMINSVTSYSDNSPVGGGLAKREESIARLIDMKKEAKPVIEYYLEEHEKIVKKIESVESDLHKEILLQRYVDGKLWQEIADNLNYSESHVRKYLHYQALDAYEKVRTYNR